MAEQPNPNDPKYLPGPNDTPEQRQAKADAYAAALIAWHRGKGEQFGDSEQLGNPNDPRGPQPTDTPEQRDRMKRPGVIATTKFILDVAGIFDPTGIADLSSATISVGQGLNKLAKGEEGAGEHFVDAGISAVSALPFGDIAKIGKFRKAGKAAEAAKGATRPAEPFLAELVQGGVGGAGAAQATGGFFDKFSKVFGKAKKYLPEGVQKTFAKGFESAKETFNKPPKPYVAEMVEPPPGVGSVNTGSPGPAPQRSSFPGSNLLNSVSKRLHNGAKKLPEETRSNLRGSWEAIQASFGFDKSAEQLSKAESTFQQRAHAAAVAQSVANTPRAKKKAKLAKREASKAYKSLQAAKESHAATVARRPQSARYAAERMADQIAMGPQAGESLFGFGRRLAGAFSEDRDAYKIGQQILGKDADPRMVENAAEIAKPYLRSLGEGFGGRGGFFGGGGGGGGGFFGGAFGGGDDDRRRRRRRVGRFLNSAAGSAGSLGGKLLGGVVGGPAGAAIGGAVGRGLGKAFADITEAAVKLPKAISDWGDALLESKRRLAEVSGSFAAMFVERERRSIVRDMASARRTSTTSRTAAESIDDLKDSIAPFSDTVSNGLNVLVAAGSKVAGLMVNIASYLIPIETINKTLNEIAKAMEPQQATKPFADFLNSIENQQDSSKRKI